MAETDRPTVPNEACEHKVATHYHGSHACYTLDLCRCKDCQGARTRYERRRSRWVSGSEPSPTVDSEPVRRYLNALMDQGMGLKRIAEVSGVTHSVLGSVVYGRHDRAAEKIRREAAVRVMATTLDLADGAKVPKDEAEAILEELVARGWSKSAVARRVGSLPGNLLRGPTVQAGTLRDLRVLLDEPVPLRRTRWGLKRPEGRPPRDVLASTPGVPDDFTPGSRHWLAVMRAGLKRAVEDSIRRHGRVAA